LAFEGADSLHYAQAFRRRFFLALGGSAVAVAIAVGCEKTTEHHINNACLTCSLRAWKRLN
jgi:hypothetical protein